MKTEDDRNLLAAERCVFAADFGPESLFDDLSVENRVITFGRCIKPAGARIIKIGSAARVSGYRLMDRLHDIGFQVFMDLKLFDTRQTLEIEAAYLRWAKPEIVTVSAHVGVETMKRFKGELPCTEVIGVTFLTGMSEQECTSMYSCTIAEAVRRFTEDIKEANLDGIVCAPREIGEARQILGPGKRIYAPGIRPKYIPVKHDDQNPDRVMTPGDAIRAGADRIIVGRPVTMSPEPCSVAAGILSEIKEALPKSQPRTA